MKAARTAAPKVRTRRFTPVVIPASILDSIEDTRARERKRGKRVKVESYERRVGSYLSVQQRKALLWAEIERLCRMADIHGVTEDDRRSAAVAIHLIDDTYGPRGVRVSVVDDRVASVERVKAKPSARKAKTKRYKARKRTRIKGEGVLRLAV